MHNVMRPINEDRCAPFLELSGIGQSVSIRPVDTRSRVVMRVDLAAVIAIGAHSEFNLDLAVNSCAESDSCIVTRLGPDEWLLLGQRDDPAALVKRLTESLAEVSHSLVDVSHRQLGVEVAGKSAADVINGGCPLDLSDRAFPPGSATRTVFGKVEVLIFRKPGQSVFQIEAGRSYFPYVVGLLTELSGEFS